MKLKRKRCEYRDNPDVQNYQTTVKQLRDVSRIYINIHLQLWKDTAHLRRQYIRDRSRSEILKEFPVYLNPLLASLSITNC
jgi:hypothetical protein